MRTPSIRVRMLIISTVVAVLIAGIGGLLTLLLGAHVIGDTITHDANRAALIAGATVEHRLVDVYAASAASGTAEAGSRSQDEVSALNGMRTMLKRAGITNVEFALYNQSLDVVWMTSPAARLSSPEATRDDLRTSRTVRTSPPAAPSRFSALLGNVALPRTMIATPVSFPDGTTGVLSVLYSPQRGEEIAGGVAWPMFGIGVLSVILTVVFMYAATSWMLRRVEALRMSADSIDAGRLDERLPVTVDDEFGVLAQSLNRLIERLERRSVAQSRFVADASHEIASPVAGIRGYTNILRAWGADDPRVRDEAITAIDRESRRMARLTDELLSLLHADQGLVLKTERFDLNALARRQLAMSASRWLDKSLEYTGPAEAPLVMVGDPDRIEDVLSILLDNASKYTPVGGSITLSTHRQRDTVLIDVTDTGQGIAEADIEHLFDRFYRTAASRSSDEGGFGLGLAIAKSILASMGGDISVWSVVGQGTTFTVQLPRGRV